MKRISRTVIAGCALSAITAAICTASARAESLQSSDVQASAKDGGAAMELAAKDGGKSDLELAAKDGGRNDFELAAKGRPCAGSKSMLTSAGEFAQDELLGQTADDMQTHVNPKSLEYMPRSTI